MRTSFSILFLSIFLFSCTSKVTKKENETYKIISLLIDEFGKASPPPPPPGELYSLSEKQKDSINNQDQNIVLYPTFYVRRDEIKYNKNYGNEFKDLTNNLRDLESNELLNLSKIRIKRPYQLSILDTLKKKKDRRYIEKNFDKLLIFSNISFNESHTKAVVTVGVNMGPLNGYSSLVFLEKQNGEWRIKGTNTLSIS